MSGYMQDPMFFYAVAFFLFVALVFVFGRKPALQWIDGEIAKISSELTTAAGLRAEAEAALADCKAKQARAEAEAKMIVDMAKQEVEAMRKQADADMASTLSRQQQLATERIHMAQAEAIESVRAAAISLGMELARKTLTENLSEDNAAKLVEAAISDIPALKKA